MLTAPASSSVGGNGVYIYTSTMPFPTTTYASSNYYVDVTFASQITTVPPSINLYNPVNTAATNVSTPLFSGIGSTVLGSLPTVTVSIYSGQSATGTPVQTLSTTVNPSGSFSVASAKLADGTYTAVATQSNSAGLVGVSPSQRLHRRHRRTPPHHDQPRDGHGQ